MIYWNWYRWYMEMLYEWWELSKELEDYLHEQRHRGIAERNREA